MGDYPWFKGQESLVAVAVMGMATFWGASDPLACAVLVLALPLAASMVGPWTGLMVPLLGMLLPEAALLVHGAPLGMLAGALGYGVLVSAPAMVAFAWRWNFWKALLTQWMGMLAAGVCLALGLRALVGTNLFTGSAKVFMDYLLAQPNSDQLLLQLAQAGVAGVTKEMAAQQDLTTMVMQLFSNRVVLLPQVRAELAATALTTMEGLLYLKGPEWLVNLVVGGGLAVLCVPIGHMRRHDLDTLAMPAFTTWHLPRGMGRGSLILLAGFALRYLGPGMVEVYLGIMLVSAFQWIYMIQGAALWEYTQKKMGRSQAARRGFIAAAGLLFPMVLVALGLIDQVRDSRGLRPKDDNEEEDIDL